MMKCLRDFCVNRLWPLVENGFLTVALLMIMVALTGILPQTVIAITVLLLCIPFFVTDTMYMAFPVMLYYYRPLGILFGVSVYRWFSMLFFFSMVLEVIKKKRRGEQTGISFDREHFIPVLILFIFSAVALGSSSLRVGVFAFFDVLIVFLLVTTRLSEAGKAKVFFCIFAVSAMLSFLSGVVTGNVYEIGEILGKSYIHIIRYKATFEDPNYMGFFFTMAIFSVVALKPFKKKVNLIVVCVLYLMLFFSMSISSVLINIMVWLIYLILTKNVRKYLPMIGIVAGGAVAMYFIALMFDSSNVFTQFALRIQAKLADLFNGNLDSFTTYRTFLTGIQLKKYAEQPILRQLFGMHSVNALYLNPDFTYLAHNEYVDWLHNIGAVGALLMLVYVGKRYLSALSGYRKDRNGYNLNIVLQKSIWILYAFTLTIFMDYRFMIPLFM